MSPAGMEKAMSPAALEAGRSLLVPKRCQQMRTPGLEPGSQAWEACMMPLHYVRSQKPSFARETLAEWQNYWFCLAGPCLSQH